MVNSLRLVREARAVVFLRQQRFAASALEIGVAALIGEARASAIPLKAKEAIGLSIAVELVRRKLARRQETIASMGRPGASRRNGGWAVQRATTETLKGKSNGKN
jgi:hypothetical protein